MTDAVERLRDRLERSKQFQAAGFDILAADARAILDHIAALEKRAADAEAEHDAAKAEIAQVVAWLRLQPNLVAASPAHVHANTPAMLADAIEAGQHKGNG